MPQSKKAAKPQLLTEFTLFPKIPREIRDVIWAKSIPGFHIVEVYVVKREPRESEGLYEVRALYKVPVMLQVCQGSRRVALKLYTKILENQFGERLVYFNAALDILHLRDGNVFGHLYRPYAFNDSVEWAIQQIINPKGASPQLLCLQIGIDNASLWFWVWDMRMALKAFGSPELVVFTTQEQPDKYTHRRKFEYMKKKVQEVEQEINVNHNDGYSLEVLVLSTLQLKEMMVSLITVYKINRSGGQKARVSTWVKNLGLSLY